ncbi:MAG TPA: ABC transporter permease [Candidatus Stackebrandtia faecavium]|nr:ABC transporter permease [Candidatus Stackebrandtia faecavium]
MTSTRTIQASKRRTPRTLGLSAMWRHRRTLRVLVQRDLAVKYQKTVMGYFWSLIEPLGMAAIYWFVFGLIYAREGDLPEGVTFGLYIVAGMFAWMWANQAMSESATSLTSQASLITTMRVPRELFPVARVIARFAEFLAGLPVLIGFAIFGGGQFGWNLLVLPVAVLLQAVLLTGFAFILASVNVLYRDVQRFMRLAMRILFYATPVIYPIGKIMDLDKLPDLAKTIYHLNPLVGVIELHHYAWIADDRYFSLTFVLINAATAIAVLFFGRWLFHKLEPNVLKEL